MDPTVIRQSATMGTPPPAGAPVEESQPITDAGMAEMLARARANEKPLAPFDPKPEDQIVIPAPEPNAAEKLLAAVKETRPARSHQPAASDTDSPSRGIPKPITDPGKVITGGFGNVGEAQYFAITGLELAELVRSLMDQMSTRMKNDLRFAMALCYPKISVKLKLEVDSYAQNEGIVLEYVKVPEKQTPVEVAIEKADHVCFVLIEQRREFSPQGEPEDAPDRIRESLGLQVPRKQIIEAAGGQQVVDLVPDIQESF